MELTLEHISYRPQGCRARSSGMGNDNLYIDSASFFRRVHMFGSASPLDKDKTGEAILLFYGIMIDILY